MQPHAVLNSVMDLGKWLPLLCKHFTPVERAHCTRRWNGGLVGCRTCLAVVVKATVQPLCHHCWLSQLCSRTDPSYTSIVGGNQLYLHVCVKLELFACDSGPVISVYRTVHVFKSQYVSVWSVNLMVRKSHQNFFWRFSKFAKSSCQFRHVCLSVHPSTCNNSATTERNSTKFDI